MDVTEAIQKKKKLEEEILLKLREFEQETGLFSEEVNIARFDVETGYLDIYRVNVIVRLA